MAVHGEGYCYNNEVNNKQAEVAVCDNTPTPQHYTLNYMIADLQNWTFALTQQALHNQYITPCDGNILVINYYYYRRK